MKQRAHVSVVFSVFMSAASFLLMGVSADVSATNTQQVSVDSKIQDAIRGRFSRSYPSITVSVVESTPVDSVYRVVLDNGDVVYGTADGRHLFIGDLLSFSAKDKPINLTKNYHATAYAKRLAAVPKSELITFAAQGQQRAALYVFTDVDCGYCRKFHAEVPALNAQGITVHYLAWPRAGLDAVTGKKMVDVWCAKDRQAAMTQAKSSVVLKRSAACKNPIKSHLDLGMQIGVRGTPAVFLENGMQIGGFRTAKEITDELGL